MTASRIARHAAIGLALAVLPAASPVASAATIELVLATRLTIGATAVRVDLDLRNQGDATALGLAPTVEFQSRVVAGPAVAILQPSAMQTVSISVPIGESGPVVGRWPLLIRVSYGDGDGQRFEAIHVDVARFGGSTGSAGVSVHVPGVRLETDAPLRVEVDRGAMNEPIRLAFATPAGVIVSPRVVTVDPGSRATEVPLSVSNAGAATPSRLPLVTLAEFDRNGIHDTVAVVSMIEIGPSTVRSRTLVTIILLALTILAAAAIVMVVRRARHPAGRMR